MGSLVMISFSNVGFWVRRFTVLLSGDVKSSLTLLPTVICKLYAWECHLANLRGDRLIDEKK